MLTALVVFTLMMVSVIPETVIPTFDWDCPWQSSHESARQMEQDGRYDEAWSMYEDLHRAYPRSDSILVHLTIVRCHVGEFECGALLQDRVRSYIDSQQFSSALALLDDLERMGFTNIDLLLIMGQAYLDAGQYEKAIELFRDQHSSFAHWSSTKEAVRLRILGDAYHATGKDSLAAVTHAQSGNTLLKDLYCEEAVGAFRTSLRLDSSITDVWPKLVRAYRCAENLSAVGVDYFSRAADADTTDAVWYALGEAYFDLGDLETAQHIFQRLADKDPTVRVQNFLWMIQLELGNAVPVLLLTPSDSSNAFTALTQGIVLMNAGKDSAAAQCFRNCFALSGMSKGVWDLPIDSVSEAALETLLVYDSTNSGAYAQLSLVHLRSGDYASAEALISQAAVTARIVHGIDITVLPR